MLSGLANRQSGFVLRKNKCMSSKEYHKEYNQKNKGKRKEYREKHKSEKKEYNKQYKIENKEKTKEYNKDYRGKNKEKLKKGLKKYREENKNKLKEYSKKNYLKKSCYYKNHSKECRFKKYNITLEEYNIMLEKQNYKCAICGKTKSENGKNGKSFAIDHNHETGEVRGLLCNNCNAGIGFFKDSVEITVRATAYLIKTK